MQPDPLPERGDRDLATRQSFASSWKKGYLYSYKSKTQSTMISKNALLTVAKRPAPGRTKTRLTPPLTPIQASALYEHFLCDTLELIRRTPDVQRLIAYLPLEEQGYFQNLAPDFSLLLQEGNDLGARLDNAIQHHLQLGYEKVVIMDSDSPTLPVACLQEAFSALRADVDVTLGPCDDGGYYLIGLKAPAPRLLRDVQMSTTNVVADTLALAQAEGLRVHLLPTWYDIDDASTLSRLIAELRTLPAEIAQHTRQFLQSNPEITAFLQQEQAELDQGSMNQTQLNSDK